MHCTIPYHCSWFSYPHRRDIVLDFSSFLVLLARVYAVAKRFRTHAFKIFMYNAPDFSSPIPLLSPLEWIGMEFLDAVADSDLLLIT